MFICYFIEYNSIIIKTIKNLVGLEKTAPKKIEDRIYVCRK